MSGALVVAPPAALAVVGARSVPVALVAGSAVLGASQVKRWAAEQIGEHVKESYREFMSRRQPELRASGMSQGEAMKQIGKEWKALKQSGSSPSQSGGQKVSETKLKGARSLQSLRLEVPYVAQAAPDLAAAWDVAEGLLDFLMSNASEQPDAFRQRAIAAHARAKGLGSQGDQTEYELGQNLGEALLLVMAYRGLSSGDWLEMSPPQLGQGEKVSAESGGLVSSGLELLGLEGESGNQVVKEVAKGLAEAGGQTVLDLLR